MFKTRQSADTWAAWSSDSSRTLVPPLWIDPGEQSSLHLVEHSLTAPTKRREDWRVVRRLVGVGNSSLIRKAKAACPSRTGKGTESQLPISTQVSKCFLESCASALTWLKKWKTNAIATNVLPTSAFIAKCHARWHRTALWPVWVGCWAQGKQPVSLPVLSSLYSESGLGIRGLELPVRRRRRLRSLCCPCSHPAAILLLLIYQQQNLLF